jgi:hypothetical protein
MAQFEDWNFASENWTKMLNEPASPRLNKTKGPFLTEVRSQI